MLTKHTEEGVRVFNVALGSEQIGVEDKGKGKGKGKAIKVEATGFAKQSKQVIVLISTYVK